MQAKWNVHTVQELHDDPPCLHKLEGRNQLRLQHPVVLIGPSITTCDASLENLDRCVAAPVLHIGVGAVLEQPTNKGCVAHLAICMLQ